MKKFFLIIGLAGFVACNNDGTTTNTDGDTTTNTNTTATAAGTETGTNSTTNSTATTTYTASEGDVSYRNGKVMVYRNGQWVESDKDVNLEGGVVVRRNGRVERNGQVVKLEEGETVDRTGRFFDKAGNAIENAWDATKRGAKKAKEEVKEVFKDEKNN